MPAISRSIRRTETPDGAVLLDVERGQMFSVNGVGSKILELLGAGLDETQIAIEISSTYGEGLERIRADVGEFLDELHRRHIVDQGPTAAHR
jgi:Coenzyme PQQ synthesis protein D (PqqD)